MSEPKKAKITFGPTYLTGPSIVENALLTETVEDWSAVRSPGRARRRRAQGHRQNIRYVEVPRREVYSVDGGRTLVAHPAVVEDLRRELAKQIERTMGVPSALLGPAR